MEGGGAATCGFVNLISRQFRMSGKVWGAAGGVLQAAWCPLAPFKRPAPLPDQNYEDAGGQKSDSGVRTYVTHPWATFLAASVPVRRPMTDHTGTTHFLLRQRYQAAFSTDSPTYIYIQMCSWDSRPYIQKIHTKKLHAEKYKRRTVHIQFV